MKANRIINHLKSSWIFMAILLLGSGQTLFCARALPKKGPAIAASATPPTSINTFGSALNTFNSSFAQATTLISNFDPNGDDLEALDGESKAAHDALAKATADLSLISSGFNKVKNNTTLKPNLKKTHNIDEQFIANYEKQLTGLREDLRVKQLVFLDRVQQAEAARADAEEARNRAQFGQAIAQGALARAEGSAQKNAEEAALEKELARRAQLTAEAEAQKRLKAQEVGIRQIQNAKTLQQMLLQAQLENERLKLESEARKKEFEQLNAQQTQLMKLLPPLKAKADQAAQADAAQKKLTAQITQLQQSQSGNAQLLREREAALARALQDSAGLRDAQNTAARLAEEMKQLRAHNDQLQKENTRIQTLSDENLALNQRVIGLQAEQQQTTGLNDELARLRQQLLEMEALRTLNNELSSRAAEADTLRAAEQKAAKELSDSVAREEKLQVQLTDITAQLAATKRDDEQRASDAKRQDDELKAQAQALAQLRDANRKLNDQLAAAAIEKQALADAHAKIATLDAANSKLQQLNREMENLRPLADQAKRIPELEAELAQLRTQHDTENKRLREENSKQAAELAKIKAADEANRNQVASLTAAQTQLQQRNDTLEKQAIEDAALRGELDAARKAAASQEAERMRLLQLVADGEQKLALETASHTQTRSEVDMKYNRLQDSYANLETQLSAAQQSNSKLTDAHRIQLEALRSELADALRVSDNSKSVHENALKELAQALADRDTARRAVEAAEEQTKAIAARIAELEATQAAAISDAQRKAAAAEKVLEAQTAELEELRRYRDSLAKLIDSLTTATRENATVTRQLTSRQN
jgi:hypothetical protein